MMQDRAEYNGLGEKWATCRVHKVKYPFGSYCSLCSIEAKKQILQDTRNMKIEQYDVEEGRIFSDDSVRYAVASWTVDDLTNEFNLTSEEAESFLDSKEEDLRSAMIAAGWDYLRAEIVYKQNTT